MKKTLQNTTRTHTVGWAEVEPLGDFSDVRFAETGEVLRITETFARRINRAGMGDELEGDAFGASAPGDRYRIRVRIGARMI